MELSRQRSASEDNLASLLALPNNARLTAARDAPSADALAFIGALLEPSLPSRLDGSGVRAHPFFAAVDWSRLYADAPVFRPELETEQDTSYFDGKRAQGLGFPDGFEAQLQAELAAAPPTEAESCFFNVHLLGARNLALIRERRGDVPSPLLPVSSSLLGAKASTPERLRRASAGAAVGSPVGSPRLKSRRPSRGWGSSSPVAGSPAQTPRFQRDERKGSGLRAGMTVDAEAGGEADRILC